MTDQEKSEKKTLYFLDLKNDELCYLNYEYGQPWNFGRYINIAFSLRRNSSDELVYKNIVVVAAERTEEDLEPALRLFLHLYRNNEPVPEDELDHFLAEDLRNEYQFPEHVNDNILAARVLEALESFESYHPVEGLSNLDLMISLDVERQSLLRTINRLTNRGIVKLIRMGPKYAIADYDKADDYRRKLMGELPDPPQQLMEIQRRIGFRRNR